jgi:tRNA threonylcarbamoyladenosine biosynthesis protein TsaE
MSVQRDYFARDEAATIALGARLATRLQPGCVVFLHGDLGAGKTTMVRGMLQHLLPGLRVKSPTYTLVERYQIGALLILHLDLYRLGEPGELEYLGVREHAGQAVLLVEWPQKAAGELPPPDLELWLSPRAAGREIRIQAHGERGAALMPDPVPELDRS